MADGMMAPMGQMKLALQVSPKVTGLKMDHFKTLAVWVFGGVRLKTILSVPLTTIFRKVAVLAEVTVPSNEVNQFVA